MSWNNVKLIFQREVRDQIRDRRTLFMVAVLPLLLYPPLGIAMLNMTVSLATQIRRAVIVGADQMPEPSLMDGQRFDPRYFDSPDDVEKLELVTDRAGSLAMLPDEAERQSVQTFLDEVEQRRDKIDRLAEVQWQLDRLPAKSPEAEGLLRQRQDLRRDVEAWFSTAPVQVLIVFPRNFLAEYQRLDATLESQTHENEERWNIPRPVVLHNSANEKSEIAYRRVAAALGNWESVLLERRLKTAQLPPQFTNPVPIAKVDLAEADQIAANVWSKIFPGLLVMMSMFGAFYPAIDLGAGEKERGTMETLLISPATRTEIVFGKFLTVLTFSFSTALLNLASMGVTGLHMLSKIGAARSTPLGDLSFPPLVSLLWVVLLAVPVAALFSALSLALAMFARSSKEGQYYFTPLFLLSMGLMLFCLYPGVEIIPYYSILPVIGPDLLLKSLLLGGMEPGTIALYAIPVLLTSGMYCGLALWWAVDQFQREDILFREAERFELRLWIRHLLREKEGTPSFAEAGVCFVIIAMLQYVFLISMQGSAEQMKNANYLLTLQLIFLIATVGTPPVFMALLLTTSTRQSLKLRLPSWRMMLGSVVLSLTLVPLALELLAKLDPFFPPSPPGTKEIMAAMGKAPLWLSLATFALAPAVCEELAFRGFILSGLQRSRRVWLPIFISALMFGVIHLIPKQQFNAALLGIVLGLIAVRSGSLLPGMLFHFLFNGTQVLASRIQTDDFQGAPWNWFIVFTKQGGESVPHFTALTLVGCGLISAAILTWLVRSGSPQDRSRNDQLSSVPPPTEPDGRVPRIRLSG